MGRQSFEEGRYLTFYSASPGFNDQSFLVQKVNGSEGISKLFRFEISLISRESDVDLKKLLSFPASLGIRYAIPRTGGNSSFVKRGIHGMLESLEERDSRVVEGTRWRSFRAVLVPRVSLLGLSRHTRVFEKRSLPGMIKDLLKSIGLTDKEYSIDLGGDYPEYDQALQFGMSDWDFLLHRMEYEGVAFHFEHHDDESTEGKGWDRICFSDGPDSRKPLDVNSTFPFCDVKTPAVPGMQAIPSVTEISRKCSISPGEWMGRDYDWKNPTLELRAKDRTRAAQRPLVQEYAALDRDPGRGSRLAGIRLEEQTWTADLYRGRGEINQFLPGKCFTLTDHPVPEMNREYLLVSVEHRMEQSIIFAGGGTGQAGDQFQYHNSFELILPDTPFRPKRKTAGPTLPPFFTATVGPDDGSDYPNLNENGEVTVRFHFDAQEEPVWVRARYGQTNAQGFFHVPRAGEEVAVTFPDGDVFADPVVLFALPNMDRKPPVTDENHSQSIFCTPNGNKLLFEDLSDSEMIRIETPGEMEQVVEKGFTGFVAEDYQMKIDGAQKISVGTGRHVSVGENDVLKVTENQHVDVEGNSVVDVGGNSTQKVEGTVSLAHGSNSSLKVTGDHYLKAANLVVEASSGLTLKCGGTSIVLDSSGVTIKGSAVTIDGTQTKINSGSGSSAASGSEVEGSTPMEPEAPVDLNAAAEQSANLFGWEIPTALIQLGAGIYRLVKSEMGDSKKEAAPEDSRPDDSQVETPSWIEIKLEDEEGIPQSKERFRIKLADGSVVNGRLNEDGFARVEGISPGEAEVTFPRQFEFSRK